jgi:hypothetical protein
MTLDEFRQEMAAFRQDVVREGHEYKDPYIPGKRLRTLYRKFDAEERAMADQVLAEWVLSDDENVRHDGRTLIEEFEIRPALPALEELAARLAAIGTPRACNELEMVDRTIRELTGGK